MINFDQDTLNYISSNNLIGIKAGHERDNFLNIWMVVVDNRVYARSWGLSERSWYNTFLQEPNGQIKCGNRVIDVKASAPAWDEDLNARISQAYLDKYDEGDNSFYAHGIAKPEHVAKTMELMPL